MGKIKEVISLDPNKLFTERLRELIRTSPVKKVDIAKELNFQSRSAITKYEKGQIKDITITTIKKFADFFDVSPAWLSGFSDKKYDDKKNKSESH